MLGAVVRLLLEESHPDGLDGDDIRQVLDALRAGRGAVAAGRRPARGAGPAGRRSGGVRPGRRRVTRPDASALARHAPLLVADLLAATGVPLDDYLAAAFAEIERTERQD